MQVYLCIITTILVITQIIRVIQNVLHLRRNTKLMEKQMAGIDEITNKDLATQRRAYQLLVSYLEDYIQSCESEDET